MTERRKKILEDKKKNPFGFKVRFVNSYIFRKFNYYAVDKLNGCGWMFEENSNMHKLWILHHCKFEELELIYRYKINSYARTHNNDLSPTIELGEIFKEYLIKAFELYKETSYFCPTNDFYTAWFEKNIKKLNSYR